MHSPPHEKRPQLICPSGRFATPLSRASRKNISVFPNANQSYSLAVHPTEGRIAIVTNAGLGAVGAGESGARCERSRSVRTNGAVSAFAGASAYGYHVSRSL